jgi:hypothetical protein
MIRYEQPIATIYPLRDRFTNTLEQSAKWNEWKKEFNAVTWSRERTYRNTQAAPALFQLLATPQKSAPEWHGPTFVVGEAKGTVQQHVELTQLEVRSRTQFSAKLGGLLHKSWRLTAYSTPLEVPHIEARPLTDNEHETHAQFGGSSDLQLVPDAQEPTDYILGYDFDWFIREGAEHAQRYGLRTQMGMLALQDLRQTAEQVLPDTLSNY